jgi:hypothetical protein
MKLDKQNFQKYTLPDGSQIYSYTCVDTQTNESSVFHIRQSPSGEIYVYKGDEFDNDLQSVFMTKDKLEAWTKFEEMVDACSPQQGSSGGFMKNPQNNPEIIPLVAVIEMFKNYGIVLFGMLSDGNQVEIMRFEVPIDKMKPLDKTKVFVRDFSDLEVPDLFKCELAFRYVDSIKFEADKNAEVFFFIPKQILQQGSNDDNPSDDTGKVEKGKQNIKNIKKEPPIQKPHQGKPEDGEPPIDEEPPQDGEPPIDSEPPQDGEPKPDGEPDDNEPPQYGQPKPSGQQPIDRPQLLQELAQALGKPVDLVEPFFSRVNSGEVFLLSNNFPQIKNSLNLPPNTTARDLATQINKLI